MKKIIFLALAFAALFITSCERTSKDSISEDVNMSLNDNQKAKSLSEWSTSENTPEKLFKKWQSSHRSSQEVCEELGKVSGQELALFESEIENDDNADLLKNCKSDLQKKLKDYWKSEKENINKKKIDKQASAESSLADAGPVVSALGEDAPAETMAKVGIKQVDTSHGYFGVDSANPKELILTFDDGPHPKNTILVLKILKQFGIKATFFAMGKNVRANPNLVRMEAEDGHSIGSHSVTHACLAAKSICQRSNGGHMLSYQEAVAQITGGHQAVYDAIGWVDPFFRFPYGESSLELKTYLKSKSVGEFYWELDSEDWKSQSVDHLLTNELRMIHQHNHGIMLMHDIQTKTTVVLPQLLKTLVAEGFTFLVLQPKDLNTRYNSELVRLK